MEELGRFAARVKKVVGDESVRGFARRAEIDDKSLRAYMAGTSDPSRAALVGIARAGGVSVAWLASGEDVPTPTAHSESPVVSDIKPGYAYIPLYDVAARAGNIGPVIEIEEVIDSLAFKEDWIRQELHAKPDDLRLIYVEGDSMEPDLRAGDIILIDHTDTTARREGIYVLRMDGALLVKNLQRLPGGLIKVMSKNTIYKSFTMKADDPKLGADFGIVGRVVWACRRF